jgi:hypothetical protein
MKTSTGFIRIIIFLIVAIGLLLVSRVDIRNAIDGIDVANFINNSRDIVQEFYTTHLQKPLARFVFQPAILIYGYIKLYLIDAIVDLIQQSTE